MTADCDEVEIRVGNRAVAAILPSGSASRSRSPAHALPLRCLVPCGGRFGRVCSHVVLWRCVVGILRGRAAGHALRRDAPQRGRDGHLSLARARRSRRAARSVFGRQGRAARRPRPRTRRRGATNPRIASSSPSRSCSRKARTAPPGAPSTLQPPHAPAIRAARRGDRRRPAGARSSSRRDTASPSCT